MEDFVTFEIAKKLKEKGFKEECLAYYTSEYTLYNNKVVLCDDKYLEIAEIDYEECLRSFNTQKDRFLRTIVDAPTISQVLKWLREENEIYINIVSYFSYAPKNNVAFAFCARYKEGDDWRDVEINESYLTYEECALSSIEYVLDNLI